MGGQRAQLKEMLDQILKQDAEQANHILETHFFLDRKNPSQVPPPPIVQPTEGQFKQF